MIPRARFLWTAGYTVMMVDLQAHGESSGQAITWGHLESRDAISAVHWLRGRCPNLPVAVLGTSLGGAAALLAEERLGADALIVEGVFADIRQAVRNRIGLRLGGLAGVMLEPLLTCQLEWREGINPRLLAPAESAKRVSCPLFVIHGAIDRHARIEEGRAIYQNCQNPAKRWWEIDGAAHVDLYHRTGHEYERRVLEFLAESGVPAGAN